MAVAAGALAGGTLLWRRNPSACPYSQRWSLELPKPGVSVARMLDLLEPRPKERLLEIGPGGGYYSLPVAERLEGGKLDVLDLQQEFLDLVERRAKKRGLENVTGWQGDARELLFESNRFDGAFLTLVLGEIPDQDAALRELARVVRPNGRIVVGETAFDPHHVTLGSLRRRAEAAGLRFERKAGTPLGYVARFAVPDAAA